MIPVASKYMQRLTTKFLVLLSICKREIMWERIHVSFVRYHNTKF